MIFTALPKSEFLEIRRRFLRSSFGGFNYRFLGVLVFHSTVLRVFTVLNTEFWKRNVDFLNRVLGDFNYRFSGICHERFSLIFLTSICGTFQENFRFKFSGVLITDFRGLWTTNFEGSFYSHPFPWSKAEFRHLKGQLLHCFSGILNTDFR